MNNRKIYMTGIIKKNTAIVMAGVCILSAAGCGSGAGKKYDAGMEQFEAGKYEDACSSFSEAVAINPDKAEYYIAYGMALIGMAQYEEARTQFQNVVRNTDNKIVRENNKRAYRGIALTYYNEGNYGQAKGYLELALKTEELEELNQDLMAYMANCELLLNDYERAMGYWNKLIGQDAGKAEMSEYYLGRAKTQNTSGNFSGAIQDYQSAIENNSDNYQAYLGLYLTLASTMDESGAKEVLEQARKKAENDSDNIIYAAIFDYYAGDYKNAAAYFEEAKKQGNRDAVYYEGRISQDEGRYEDAMKLYDSYLEAKPIGSNAELCNQYAGCLMELKRYDEALEWLKKGVAMAAGGVRQQLMFNQVVAYERTGDFKSAKEVAAEYLKSYTDEDMQKEFAFIKTRCADAE